MSPLKEDISPNNGNSLICCIINILRFRFTVSISYYEMDTFISLKLTEKLPHNASPLPPLPTYIISIQLPTRRTTK